MVTELDLENSTCRVDSQHLRLIKLSNLRAIKRFDGENFDGAKMIHQTTLDTHEARTHALYYHTDRALLSAGIRINSLRGHWLIGLHDDHEVITKDIPTPVKQAMSKKERAILESDERAAIRVLARWYMLPEFQNLYIELWEEAQQKQTREAQAADVADKWDALGETIHEIRCGNTDFLQILQRYKKLILPKMEESGIWKIVSKHPYIRLDEIPSPEEANRFPKISLDTLRNSGYTAFWRDVLEPADLPEFYKRWMTATFRCGLDLDTPGTPLFPGWPNEGLERDPKSFLMMVPHRKIR